MSERHEAYLYHITFNAMHNLTPEDPKKMHAHTFCVGIYVIEEQDDHPVFVNSEKVLQKYFDRYRGIRLNELSPFTEIVPTLENMGEVFYWDLKPIFVENGMKLLLLEMGDSPISTYCIGERPMIGNVYSLVLEKSMKEYCERVHQRYGQQPQEEEWLDA